MLSMGLLGACSFPRPFEGAPEDPLPDAAIDALLDHPPDAAPDSAPDGVPCQPGFIDLCTSTARPESLTVAGIMEIDTDMDPRCVVRAQSGGPSVCLLYFEAITLPPETNLRVFGARPVVLAARTTLSIEGVLDISSRRTRLFRLGPGHNVCTSIVPPDNDPGGGGGGGGGSFSTEGGQGGDGDSGDSAGGDGTSAGGRPGTVVSAPPVLRGGCAGQRGGTGTVAAGEGGPSGGAAYLFSKGALTISGTIYGTGAGGGGGAGDSGSGGGGGGGGGSGGMIVVESETSSSISGMLLTNGGGGGAGGRSFSAVNGLEGSDAFSAAAAPGGSPSSAAGGGAGATFTGNSSGLARSGAPSPGGAGGGGGGLGFILVRGANRQVTGTLIPPAIMMP